MRRRRIILAALARLLAAAGLVAYLLWPALRSPINPDNFARIARGQTLAQVEAILGGPPRDESTGPLGFGEAEEDFGMLRSWERFGTADARRDAAHTWQSDAAVVRVWFDDGKVFALETSPAWREGWISRQLNTWLAWW